MNSLVAAILAAIASLVAVASFAAVFVSQLSRIRKEKTIVRTNTADLLWNLLAGNEADLNAGISLVEVNVAYNTEEDSVERKMCFKSGREHSTLLIHQCSMGGQGIGVHRMGGLSDMNLRAYLDGTVPIVLPGVSGASPLIQNLLVIGVLPPNRETMLHLSYRWPSLWSPLRNNGRDNGSYALRVALSQLVLSFIGAANRHLELSRHSPDIGKITSKIDDSNRPVLTWNITNPSPGLYTYTLLSS